MEQSDSSVRVRHKGRFIKRKTLDRKMTCEQLGAANKGRKAGEPGVTTNDSSEAGTSKDSSKIVGNRIVDLSLLAAELECDKCNTPLLLKNIERETKRGLGSFLYIRCEYCLLVKTVPTSRCVDEPEGGKRKFFDINYQIIMSCLHAGIGNQGLNKLLACGRIPTMNWRTHKEYERRVGPVVEEIAKKSCDRAAKIERELTIKNVEEIEKIV